jgi:DNA-formamidopyrimidine glycosylase
MPEGPELARSRDFLRKLIQGRRFRGIEILGGRYADKHPEGMQDLLSVLHGTEATIDSVNVKGKFMWWTLALKDGSHWYMWCTYGMSGQWTTAAPDDQHFHVRVWTDKHDGSALQSLHFRDPRHFGTLKFVNDKKKMERKLNSLGPDMLNDPPTGLVFMAQLLKKPGRTLAEALMDQSVISGVGNYIKAEALYLSELSPHRTVESLKMLEIMRLREQIINVMGASYNTGGATLSTYRNVDGTKGAMQRRFAVYNHSTDPMGNPVIKEETKDGRTTHWVPTVQR